MNRLAVAALGIGAVLAVAACGSAAAGTTTPSPTGGSNSNGRLARNGASGQLVQISGMTLILSNANGDTTVTYTGSTVISQTSTGTVSDIATGVCITALGQKDATGHVTAATVTVRNASNGSCAGGGTIFGGGGGGAFGGGGSGAARSPNPSFSPRALPANVGTARGLVTGVSGTSVTVQQPDGTSITITVPTTVRVAKIDTVPSSALQTGECVAAAGTKDASGAVAARSLTIVPAGPSGCFTGGRGGGFGGGGFGGGGFGGGGFGGGGGGAPGGGTSAA